MIIDTNSIITNYKIDTLADLKNLSAIEKRLGMKVNKSALTIADSQLLPGLNP